MDNIEKVIKWMSYLGFLLLSIDLLWILYSSTHTLYLGMN